MTEPKPDKAKGRNTSAAAGSLHGALPPRYRPLYHIEAPEELETTDPQKPTHISDEPQRSWLLTASLPWILAIAGSFVVLKIALFLLAGL